MIRNWDGWILFSITALFLMGEAVIISVNVVPYLMDSYQKLSIYKKPLIQLLTFLFGFMLASIIAKYDYRKFMNGVFPYLFILMAVFSLLVVYIKKLMTGKAVDRWLFGGSVQPFEFTKIALIIFLSYYIVRKGNLRQWKHLLWAIFFPAVISFLLLVQPDKGGAIFILLITSLMVYVGGAPKKAYLLMLLLFVFVVYYILTSKGYVAERLSAWRNPFADPEDSGYQIIQSLYALARGGIMGVGIGQGLQKLGPLPTSDTDYVIAIIGEEMGFVGVFAVIILYAILVGRLIWHALMSKEQMEKLLLFGVAMNFAISFLWNLAMVSNLIPPKGTALPFVSYGSSNLLASLIFLGIAQSVINHQERSLSSPLRTSPTPTILKHA
ncbi:MAG: FtsW/RodA/SpoVE family cell cycle protein [Aquificaceae bacterium]